MKVKKIELKYSSPMTEEDRRHNRENLSYLVKGVKCIGAGLPDIPKHYSKETIASIDLTIGQEFRRSVELYENGASNIFYGSRDDNGPEGFIQVRPSVLFLVHPDECFSKYFPPFVRDGWHRAVYSHVYDEVIVLWWGLGDGDNDLIPELSKVEAIYGRKLFVWQPGELPPLYCRDSFERWRNYEVEIAGCFRDQCVAYWGEVLGNWNVPFKLVDELIVEG